MKNTHPPDRMFVAVKAVILRERKLLLVQRSANSRNDHHFWEFPGGRLEFGESPTEAVIREVREETGLHITPLFPQSTWSLIKTNGEQLIGITFICKCEGDGEEPAVTLSHEHSDYAWIEREEIVNYSVFPSIIEDTNSWDWEELWRRTMQ